MRANDKCDFPAFTPIIATDSSSVAITFVICISFWPHYFHVALSYRIWCMATTANHRLSAVEHIALFDQVALFDAEHSLDVNQVIHDAQQNKASVQLLF